MKWPHKLRHAATPELIGRRVGVTTQIKNKQEHKNMSNNQPIDDIDYIEDDINAIKQNKAAHERNTKTVKHIRVRGSVEVARDQYRATKKMRKAQIKQLKCGIRVQKLLIKQAKGNYKLIKLSEKR